MSEVDEFLLQNEKILYEVHKGFIPWLFGGETLYLTTLRSIKVIWPGLFTRRTFSFLPHAVALGQGSLPSWNFGILFFGILIAISTFPVLLILRAELGLIIPVLIIIITLLIARRSALIIFGQPSISMILKETEIENALKIVAKHQVEILSSTGNKLPAANTITAEKGQVSKVAVTAAGLLGIIIMFSAFISSFIFGIAPGP